MTGSRRRTRTLTAVLFVLVLTGFVQADDNPAAKLKVVYDRMIADYLEEYRQQLSAWPERCLATLQMEKDRLQKAGDLDGWVALDKEVKRFEQKRDILDADIEAIPSSHQTLLRQLQEKKFSYAAERDRQILVLHEKYITNLENYQTQLTQAGNMEEAVAIKNEIERAEASQILATARLTMALYESERAETKEVTQAEPAPDDAHSEEAPTTAEGPTTMDDGSIVYLAGARPKYSADLVLKRFTLTRTEHVSLASSVTVMAWEGSQRKTSTSVSGYTYSAHKSRSNSDDRFLRLMLRSGRSGVELNDLLVRVRYFTQSVSSSSGSRAVAPREAETKGIALATLDQQEQYVDLAAVNFETSSSSYSSSYSGTSTSRSGNRYYGVIVSVYTRDGKLIYQGASRPQLREYASDSIPDFELEDAVAKAKRAQDLYSSTSRAYWSNTGDPDLKAAYEQAKDAHYAADAAVSALREARAE